MAVTILSNKITKLFLLAALLLTSCNGAIFWTLQNEELIERSNLPKEAPAVGMASDGVYYYVIIGHTLWVRPIDNINPANWTQLRGSNNMLGAGGLTPAVVLSSSNSQIYLPEDAGAATVLQNVRVFRNGEYALASQPEISGSGGLLFSQGFTRDGGITSWNGQPQAAGSPRPGDSGRRDNFIDAGGGLNTLNGRANSLLDIRGSALWFAGDNTAGVIGLVGHNGQGYSELFVNEDGELTLRRPTDSVDNTIAYGVSDLAMAVVSGFFLDPADPDTFFVLTFNNGLWRNTNGVWFWE